MCCISYEHAFWELKDYLHSFYEHVLLVVSIVCYCSRTIICFSDEKGKFDEFVEEKGVKVLIDPKALMHVIGTKMDFVDDPLKYGSCKMFLFLHLFHLFQLLTSAFSTGPSLCS
jgi:Fe-S cluster assembly iron-binding protein IscA